MMKCCAQWLGVNHIVIDRENHRIIVKGDVVKDPLKVLERLQKKFSKNVELLTPKPKPNNQQKKEPAEKKEQVYIQFFLTPMLLFLFYFLKKILSYLLVHFRSVTLFLIGVSRLKWKLWCSRCICIAKVVQVMSRERLRKWKVKYSYSLFYECFPSKTWHCKMLNSCKAKFKLTIIPVSEYILV